MELKFSIVFVIFSISSLGQISAAVFKFGPDSNRGETEAVPPKLADEIQGYKDTAKQIIDFVVNGKGKGQVWNRLANFTDKFGNRIAGSQNLENSIDYLMQELNKDGLDNVHGEDANVSHWVRGNECAMLIEPRRYKIAIMGLGSSVGTPVDGIEADAIIVRSFRELQNRSKEATGKIVIFNQAWSNYGQSAQYRTGGAVAAAKVGAVATLIRSAASFSIHSPHTGIQFYEDGIKKIPTACIAVEDAEMFQRMADRGSRLRILLKMEAKNLPNVVSRNTVAEVRGSTYPDQVVLVSGHLDSWDVGQGAMDDGGGAFISWQALSIVRQLGLRPKRTLRAVFWTGEEQGHVGAQQYYENHKSEEKNYDLVMESDGGTFTPKGIQFTGISTAQAIMQNVLKLLEPINATTLEVGAEAGDVQGFINDGVPGGSLLNENEKYFWFHHSDGDTMSVQDSHAMDLCSAVWAVVSYVVADLEDMLPR